MITPDIKGRDQNMMAEAMRGRENAFSSETPDSIPALCAGDACLLGTLSWCSELTGNLYATILTGHSSIKTLKWSSTISTFDAMVIRQSAQARARSRFYSRLRFWLSRQDSALRISGMTGDGWLWSTTLRAFLKFLEPVNRNRTRPGAMPVARFVI